MSRLFISQNTTNKIINTAKIYYYGPRFKKNGNDTNTSALLFGVSFDYEIEPNNEEEYFSISFVAQFSVRPGSATNFSVRPGSATKTIITQTVTNREVLDYGIGNGKDFVFQVDLGNAHTKINYIKNTIDNVYLTIANPNSKYTYIKPTEISTNSPYINILQEIYVDSSYANDYQCSLIVSLDDSSAQQSFCSQNCSVNSASEPYVTVCTNDFIERSAIAGSSATIPSCELTSEGGSWNTLRCNFVFGIKNISRIYPNQNSEFVLEDTVSIASLPSLLSSTTIQGTNYIEGAITGDYLYFVTEVQFD